MPEPITLAMLIKSGLLGAGISGIAQLFGIRSAGKQAEKARGEEARKFNILEADMQRARREQTARDEEAREEARQQWDATQAQKEAHWRNRVEAQSPYLAASRAMLGRTMQMDVPAYAPRYSAAEGVEREPDPYGPYINQQRRA